MSFRFTFPRLQAFDSNGDPLAGGKLWFYTTGTTTPEDVFSNAALTTPATNPVVANSAGRFPDIYLSAATYKVVLTDEDDVVIWTADPVTRTPAASAFMQTVLDDANAAAARATLGAGTADYAAKGTDVTSAATLDLTASDADQYFDVTGTTTITAIEARTAGREIELKFNDVLTLTHNATSLILPGGANVTTAAGDVARFRSLGSGNWRCVNYQRANGQALVTSGVLSQKFTSGDQAITLGGLITVAHGLPAKPDAIHVYLRCATADLNWSVGDEAQMPNGADGGSGAGNTVQGVYADATNIYMRVSSSAPILGNKTTGAYSSITPANWRIKFYAYA